MTRSQVVTTRRLISLEVVPFAEVRVHFFFLPFRLVTTTTMTDERGGYRARSYFPRMLSLAMLYLRSSRRRPRSAKLSRHAHLLRLRFSRSHGTSSSPSPTEFKWKLKEETQSCTLASGRSAYGARCATCSSVHHAAPVRFPSPPPLTQCYQKHN